MKKCLKQLIVPFSIIIALMITPIITMAYETPKFENKLDPNQNPAPTVLATAEGTTISSTQIAGGFVDTSFQYDLSKGFTSDFKMNTNNIYFTQEPNGGTITSDIWYALSFGSKTGWWRPGNDLFAVLVRPMSATTTAIEAQYQDSDGFKWIARQVYDIKPDSNMKLELKKSSDKWKLFLNSQVADSINLDEFGSRFLAKCNGNKAYLGYGYFYAQNTGKTISMTIMNVNNRSYKQTGSSSVSTVSSESMASSSESSTTSSSPANSSSIASSVSTAEINGITINKNELSLNVGNQITLTAQIIPSDAKGELVWSSDNEEIVVVDQKGVVEAKKSGSAIIKVTSSNGKTAQCRITVSSGSLKTIIIITIVSVLVLASGALFIFVKRKKN